MRLLILCFLVAEFSAFSATPTDGKSQPSVPDVANLDQIAKSLKLKEWNDKSFTRKIRVAILDNGFGGYQQEVGKSLPVGTVYHQGPASAADRAESPSLHGTIMAKIFAQLIKKSGIKADYELHLFNAFGYTKFKDAVETVQRERFDLVLYSQNWEFGGNGDAKGFINALVTQATTQAGVIWINAAGEFSGHMRSEKINYRSENGEDWVIFKDKKGKVGREVKISCRAPAKQPCALHLVATWNDFKDDADTGTDKDVDLFLFDSKGNKVASSERTQKLAVDTQDPNASIIPREMIEVSLPSGVYKAKFKLKSKNFAPDQFQLRIIATGKFIELERADNDETLLPPAENPNVISVGASDDGDTSRSKKLGLPNVSVPSYVQLKNSTGVFSTSTSAAMAAAVTAIYLGTGTSSDRSIIIEKLKKLSGGRAAPQALEAQVAPKSERKAAPSTTEPGVEQKRVQKVAKRGSPVRPARMTEAERCYQPVRLPIVYPQVSELLADSAVPVMYRGRLTIVTNPQYANYYGLLPPDPEHRVYITPDGPEILNLDEIREGLPRGFYLIYADELNVCD